jgi:hypothetical protein
MRDSRNDGPAKSVIVDFAAPGGPDFVAPEARFLVADYWL